MNTIKNILALTAFSYVTAYAQGQGGMPPPPPMDGTAMFMLAEFGGPNKIVVGKPFSAMETLTSTQVLPDGNRIVRKVEAKTFRDAAGRIRREPLTPGPDGALPPIMIIDPAAQTAYMLDAAAKIAYKLPPPGERRGHRGPPPDGSPPPPEGEKRGGPGRFGGEAVKDAIGTKTIDGLVVEGTRTTRTIPAGTFGNEKAISAVTERWFSADIGAYVLVIARDPRFGDTEHRMTAIIKSAPDANLFAVPAGYTISDAPPPQRRMQPPR